MRRLRLLFEELRQLRPRQLAFRLGYELKRRSGWAERREPIIHAPAPLPPHPSHAQWMASLPEHFFLRALSDACASGTARAAVAAFVDADPALITRAEAARHGRLRCFSAWEADYGSPPDWHLNPRRNARWPAHQHHSRIYAFEPSGGDIKMVWELNRFPHVFDWLRAFALDQDEKWTRAFAEQLHDWERANPFRAGANWASGQELAIRLLTWTLGVAVLGRSPAFAEQDWSCFLRLVQRHAAHLAAHLDYARFAVHNNHLLGEALGLYLSGALFPFLPGAERWRCEGRRILVDEGLQQFYEDGGYCQSSHSYHRLALHYLMWANRLDALGLQSREPVDPWRVIFERTQVYLAAFMASDGRLPNWGANDGALLVPWTSCAYADFRPLLSSLARACGQASPFPAGPWDEDAWWWQWPAATRPAPPMPSAGARSFETSGLHVLQSKVSEGHASSRQSEGFAAGASSVPESERMRWGEGLVAVLRCGSVIDRFGQADQLHVDCSFGDWNLAADGGSYLYNDELAFHRWFMGTPSHNTVSVDGEDQMILARRFKWLNWTKAQVEASGAVFVEGRHDGYERLGVRHRRRLQLMGKGILVRDWIEASDGRSCRLSAWPVSPTLCRLGAWPIPPTTHALRLHWLLDADACEALPQPHPTRWRFALRRGARRAQLELRCAGDGAVCSVIQGNEHSCDAWLSRHYGERVPVFAVTVTLQAASAVFETRLWLDEAELSCHTAAREER